MEALGIDIKLIAIQAFNFLVLLFVLKKFMYKPVLAMLDKRKDEAESAVALKSELEERVSEIDKERADVLHKTRGEAEVILNEARQKGDRVANQIELSAKEKAEQIVAKGEEATVLKEKELRAKLKNEVARISIETAEHVVGTSLTDDNKKALTDESIRRFTERG